MSSVKFVAFILCIILSVVLMIQGYHLDTDQSSQDNNQDHGLTVQDSNQDHGLTNQDNNQDHGLTIQETKDQYEHNDHSNQEHPDSGSSTQWSKQLDEEHEKVGEDGHKAEDNKPEEYQHHQHRGEKRLRRHVHLDIGYGIGHHHGYHHHHGNPFLNRITLLDDYFHHHDHHHH